ncbi:MAG: hypothetical protein ACKOFW_16040, partial [Planctomycetaceae bacterium]
MPVSADADLSRPLAARDIERRRLNHRDLFSEQVDPSTPPGFYIAPALEPSRDPNQGLLSSSD